MDLLTLYTYIDESVDSNESLPLGNLQGKDFYKMKFENPLHLSSAQC